MVTSFQQAHREAWEKVGIGTREKPAEVFPKFKKQDFENLKSDYNKMYGYTIRVPQIDDIVNFVPDALKSNAEIKAEKKENLVRILESPAPEWARKYATVMTWIDDIQDTVSVVYPALSMLSKIAPKAFSKLIPVIGWIGTFYDLLNILNAIGRAPLTGMKSKREICKFWKRNPFSKVARLERVGKIANYKPGIGDAIQAAQVLDTFTGAGLSLGAVMGLVTDSIFGAYKYATGEPVRFSFDPPDISTLGRMGSRGLKAANAISSQGQVFSEFIHFWTYVTSALSAYVLAGEFKDYELTDLVEDPQKMMVPAPEPMNPLTIAVIEEAGLNVQEGVGWPYNGEKFISISDYIDATAEPARANFINYSNRHSKDIYGWFAAQTLDSLIPMVLLAMEPDGIWHVDDTDEMKVFFKMVKAPILPMNPVPRGQAESFFTWVKDYEELYGQPPGILAIEEKLLLMGIRYETSYPVTPGPDFEKFWPKGWTGEESY